MIKSCKFCGKDFETKGRADYCSVECRKLAKSRRDMEYHNRSIYNLQLKERKKSAEKSGKRIAEAQAKASELGMSYGQYKAMLYLEEMKKNENQG